MASGDFQDLRNLAIYASRRDTALQYDIDRAGEAVNEAVQVVCDEGTNWDFLTTEVAFSVTSTTDLYTFATIAGGALGSSTITTVVKLVNDTDGGVLESMSWQALEQLAWGTQTNSSASPPVWWAQFANRIRVYPQPDATYSLTALVRLQPAEMTANADVPLIPASWRRRLVVPYAAELLLRQEGGQDATSEADRQQAKFDRALQGFRLAHGSATGPTLVVTDPSFTRSLDSASESWWWD